MKNHLVWIILHSSLFFFHFSFFTLHISYFTLLLSLFTLLALFHPLIIIFDEAFLLGPSEEPQRLFVVAVVVVAQCLREVGTRKDMVRLKAENVLYRLAKILLIVMMLTMMKAVQAYQSKADDDDRKNDNCVSFHSLGFNGF